MSEGEVEGDADAGAVDFLCFGMRTSVGAQKRDPIR